VVCGDGWLRDGSAPLAQRRQRSRLVSLHMPAIADDVGR
jgi:hypothetical protein